MFEVGEVVGARGNVKAKNLRNGGTLFARIRAAPDEQGSGMLQLQLKGVQLKNVEGPFRKSDPFFELHAKVDSAGGLTWQPVYRSKQIMNNLNPEWEPFAVDLARLCEGDFNRPVLFKLYDWNKNGKHTTMGQFETSVNGILAAGPSQAFEVTKRGKMYAGQIVVVSATLTGGSGAYSAPVRPPEQSQAFSTSLPLPGQVVGPTATAAASVSSSAPAFSQAPGGVSYAAPAPVPSTGDIPDFSQALNVPPPKFATAATAVTAANAFGGRQPSAPTAPDAYDLSYLQDALPTPLAPPMAPSYKTAAPVRPKFVDYLSGGCELELCIAIDYTGSNGDPRRPGTLHYIHPDGQLNDYEKAITAVGSIIARYDHDQKFPVWGFGAKYGGVIQHCFQVGPEPELDGLSGVLEAYRQVFRTGLTMSGPTVFAEVIGLAAAAARSRQEVYHRIGKQAYRILLMLTDGAVTDINMTKAAIHAASDAPLSIVIVGIGNADFQAMQFLDDFQASGAAGRDICQFVEFSKYKHDKSALTRETLAEIPDQLVDYFYNRGIMPLPPVSGSQLDLQIEDPDDEDIDLTMNFGEDGEISLANYNGAVYDDTKYGTATSYEPSAPVYASAHSPSPPYQPSQQSSAPYQHGSLASQQQQSYQPYQNQNYTSYQQPQQSSPMYGDHQSAPVAQATPQRLFYVQAPPGAYPGMQVQIQNPITGQQLIVAVPQGVAPGGKFGVRY